VTSSKTGGGEGRGDRNHAEFKPKASKMIKKTNQTPKLGGYVKVKLNNKIHIKVNRPFPSFASVCVRTSLRAKPYISKRVSPTGSFSCKSFSFSCERFCTRTRFETEAQLAGVTQNCIKSKKNAKSENSL